MKIKTNRKQNIEFTERNLLKLFLNAVYKKSKQGVYIYTDLDSPRRDFKSGWDALISANGKTIFLEAKRSIKNPCKNIEKKLTMFQKLSAIEITSVYSLYYIIEFIISKKPEIRDKLELDLVKITLHTVSYYNSQLRYTHYYKDFLSTVNLLNSLIGVFE